MSLTQALSSAVSGLRTTQAGMSLLAGNVANAETPGYVRKTLEQSATAFGDFGSSVRTSGINRALDLYLQRQIRAETAGGGYATSRAQFYERLQQLYGDPAASSSLAATFDDFTNALQALSTTPDDYSARTAAVSAASLMAQKLNNLTAQVQGLRSDAEQGIADAVRSANEALTRIAQINQSISDSPANDLALASLLDQRDVYIDQLSNLMDVRVSTDDKNQVSVFTTSGFQLVGSQAATLQFDAKGSLSPVSQWSADPAQRSVGTISVLGANGASIDFIANKIIRSGEIAALIEMRDQVLVQAQAQLDEIAAAMSQLLSDRQTAGTAVTAGSQTGFDIDVGALSQGNSLSLTFTDTVTNVQRRITLVRVDNPAALPLSNDATADPNDEVIGLNMFGGAPSVASQLAALFPSGKPQFSNPAGTVLRVLGDAANTVRIDAVSTTTTVTSLTGGVPELPIFVDGGTPYTGAFTPKSQVVGYAGRIAVNGALLLDPSRLVVFSTSPLTAAGDPTRPNLMIDRLVNAGRAMMPTTGIGTGQTPFTGSITDFLRQVISLQGSAAAAAQSLSEGQRVVIDALNQRQSDESGVSIDREMAFLLVLQNAYSANARVVSAVREMFDALLNM